MSTQSSERETAGTEQFHGDLLSTYGREPMMPSEREYRFWGAHGTCFAYSIATWCFLTGGIVANYVGAIQGMVCLIAGNLIGTLLVSASLSAGCHRYGQRNRPPFRKRIDCSYLWFATGCQPEYHAHCRVPSNRF